MKKIVSFIVLFVLIFSCIKYSYEDNFLMNLSPQLLCANPSDSQMLSLSSKMILLILTSLFVMGSTIGCGSRQTQIKLPVPVTHTKIIPSLMYRVSHAGIEIKKSREAGELDLMDLALVAKKECHWMYYERNGQGVWKNITLESDSIQSSFFLSSIVKNSTIYHIHPLYWSLFYGYEHMTKENRERFFTKNAIQTEEDLYFFIKNNGEYIINRPPSLSDLHNSWMINDDAPQLRATTAVVTPEGVFYYGSAMPLARQFERTITYDLLPMKDRIFNEWVQSVAKSTFFKKNSAQLPRVWYHFDKRRTMMLYQRIYLYEYTREMFKKWEEYQRNKVRVSKKILSAT